MRKYLNLLFLITLAACSEQSNQSSVQANLKPNETTASGIVGGTEVPAGSDMNKMTVLVRGLIVTKTVEGNVEYIERQVDVCTGSFIADDVVVTAAHCIFKNSSILEIVYTNNSNDYSAPTSAVDKVVIHPNYQSSDKSIYNDDIALIKIKGKKPRDYKILSFMDSVKIQNQFKITAIGFGRTTGVKIENLEDTSDQGLGMLRTTEIDVTDYQTTKNTFITNHRNGHGFCFGDSGGPGVLIQDSKVYIIGLVKSVFRRISKNSSDATELDTCKLDGAYLNINFYSDFIAETLRKFQQ